MKISKLILHISFVFVSLSLTAQGVGTWKSHLPYRNGKKVCEVGNKIFCVTENGLFYYDKDDNSTNILTKENGLSDIEITSINYHTGLQKIVLGYNSGYIDVIDKNLNVKTLADINRTTSIIGSKTINNISFYKNNAYLATSFGVVVVNLDKNEIKESYRNIGPTGQEGLVNNVIIDNEQDTIYVHNEFGICKAPISGKNLLNYQNWVYIKDTLGSNQKSFDFYTFYNGKLTAARSNGIFTFEPTVGDFVITPYVVLGWSPLASFYVRNDNLVVGFFYAVVGVYDKMGGTAFFSSGNTKTDALLDKDGFIWSSEPNYGLRSNYKGTFDTYAPTGTSTSLSFGLYSADGKIISLTGGYNSSYAPNYNRAGFSLLQDGIWQNINAELVKQYEGNADPLDAYYDPIRKKYFIANYISGLGVWDGDTTFTRLTKADSASIPFYTIFGQTRITSVTNDAKKNIWVTNHLTGAEPSIHKLLPNNTWQSYYIKDGRGSEPLDLVVDDLDQKWILAKGTALIVWNDVSKAEKTLYNATGKGNLPSSKINCIEKDRNGQIWVGTDKGVAVFTDPELAIKNDFYEATIPIFERRPLLQDEQVLSICIDGANRKWFGTANGVFLFNENASENIYAFNTENSLLPSNTVKDIAINDKTGEVFFASLNGIVSFWGDATPPNPSFASAKIFPNPVSSDFDGVVTINGLKDKAIVKITDISGKLVYDQTSNGGTATWNTKTLNGSSVAPGVYLVYSSDQEFTDQYVGKIVVVN